MTPRLLFALDGVDRICSLEVGRTTAAPVALSLLLLKKNYSSAFIQLLWQCIEVEVVEVV